MPCEYHRKGGVAAALILDSGGVKARKGLEGGLCNNKGVKRAGRRSGAWSLPADGAAGRSRWVRRPRRRLWDPPSEMDGSSSKNSVRTWQETPTTQTSQFQICSLLFLCPWEAWAVIILLLFLFPLLRLSLIITTAADGERGLHASHRLNAWDTFA